MKPFVAFHGTRAKPFRAFSAAKAGTGVTSASMPDFVPPRNRRAFFFTTNRQNAAYFADSGGFVGQYRITPTNPLTPQTLKNIESEDWNGLPTNLRGAYADALSHPANDFPTLEAAIDIAHLLNPNRESNGKTPYDAVVIEDVIDGALPSTIIAVVNDDEERANSRIMLLKIYHEPLPVGHCQ